MNKVLMAVLLAGFGAQIVKLIVLWFRHKTLTLKDLVVTGGMPSSHSAFVVSLATITFLEEGPSTLFAITLVIMLIVIRDAFGVRRSVGEEGMVINQVLKKIKLKTKTHFAMGHTPLQVLVGSLIGLVISLLVYLFL